MRTTVYIVFALFLTACAEKRDERTAIPWNDPIELLVTALKVQQHEQRGPFLPNGPYCAIPLGMTAQVEEVVSQALWLAGMPTNHFSVVEDRKVRIADVVMGAQADELNYRAVLVRTPQGDKIVLLQQPPSGQTGWWNRVYETK